MIAAIGFPAARNVDSLHFKVIGTATIAMNGSTNRLINSRLSADGQIKSGFPWFAFDFL